MIRLLAGVVLAAAPLAAHVTLVSVFTDAMVVQRDKDIAVWGTADTGEQVSVRFRGREEKTQAADGRWLLRIESGAAGGPFEMVVHGSNEIRLTNILAGEVWLASGQSNMQYTLGRPNIPPDVLEAAKEMARSANGNIRYFSVKGRGSERPMDEVIGSWKVASPGNITDCSAVAWYFVVALHKSLNVPVGLIVSSVGNTPAEAWLPQPEFESTSVASAIWQRHREELAKVPPDAAAKYQEQMERWLKVNNTPALQFANARTHPAPPYTATDNHVPCRFYNGIEVHPYPADTGSARST
jgi:sialate O-acetylesterase